ncbi:lysophospholipid acyltransferase family protein [Fimbriimonas ginsengisoli]|uniref:1-acylglycerol-3-phosphate O-acyltransferase n=1 Tax=Fimbriimonas ginsengisoli Gsoil 348 TaxID=661478 RepID=A0A068NS50_FIMGI|nr:lysophospholipid acyltransferase family protein [Fimbriimonas ginsengisoli]AIE85560.1 1-acylglycerol-3-phosphate O-acyltransferase [Fimbriimonas ginsengisoli Gsoil 348]
MADELVVGPFPAGFRKFWLPLGRMVAGALLVLLGPVKVRGAYRVPKEGGVLILANHIADMDPILVQYACGRPVHFMAKSELFDLPVIGRLMRFFGAFAVKRGEPDRKALKFSADLLKTGEAVGIFPEGQISEDGELQELKPGVALIARMAGTPVICVGISGSQRMMPYGKTIPRPAFRTVTLVWGEPRTFGKETSAEEFLAWVQGQFLTLVED